MNPSSDSPDQPAFGSRPAPRVVQLVVQPKSWLGKILFAVIGAAVLFVVLFLSIIAFAVIVTLGVLGLIYVKWKLSRARRAAQDQIIDIDAGPPGRG